MKNNESELRRRAYIFAVDIIKFIDTLNKKDRTIQVIINQLSRCSTSVGANIFEAQAGSSKKDFTNYFTYALKSSNECKFWLGLLRDTQKADSDQTTNLLNEIFEIANMLGSSILTLKGKKKL